MISKINESLTENEIIGVLIPAATRDEMLMRIAEDLSSNYNNYNKILYISTDKSCNELIGKFEENKINTDKFYFIDCITRTANRNVTSSKRCRFISSPGAKDEIQTGVFDILAKEEIDAVLFDSPFSLLKYYEHTDILQFMHLLTLKLVVEGCKGILTFQKESTDSLRKSIEMFVDKTIDMESDNM